MGGRARGLTAAALTLVLGLGSGAFDVCAQVGGEQAPLDGLGVPVADSADGGGGSLVLQTFGPDSRTRSEPDPFEYDWPRRRLAVGTARMTSMDLSWAGHGDLARVAVTLDNIGRQRVTLHWALAARGAHKLLVEQPLELSYTPTVVARRSPRDDRLYVAGWMAGETKLVIEEWTLQPLTLATEVEADGTRRTRLEPDLPVAQRRELYVGHRFDGQAPLSGLVCDTDGQRLLLLPAGPAAGLAVLDLTTRRLRPSPDLEALAQQDLTCRWISIGRHRWEGTVFVLHPREPWEPAAPDDPDALLVLSDADRDGTIERIERMDATQFGEAFWADGWVSQYAEPPPGP